ncbi:hypothetical protein Ddc_01755 [Ditylenchus destructor]|nr:hypothetical protein Ddc_01755 [Ditylenchus destructor]
MRFCAGGDCCRRGISTSGLSGGARPINNNRGRTHKNSLQDKKIDRDDYAKGQTPCGWQLSSVEERGPLSTTSTNAGCGGYLCPSRQPFASTFCLITIDSHKNSGRLLERNRSLRIVTLWASAAQEGSAGFPPLID